MNTCGICEKPVVQLFETGKPGVFACFKCQPLIPEVSLGQDQSEHETITGDLHEDDTLQDDILIEVEVPQKDLYCGICNKTFTRNMQLQNHLRNHRAERRFVCTYCNKAFSQSNNLRAHLRIHTNERPYKCQVCDKAFTQVTNLNNHVRLHTGERPFVCPEPGCNKAYAQVTNLNQHRKRHLSGRGDDNYACNICGEQFEQRNHLYTHRREVHSDTKPAMAQHVCKICDQSFRTDKQLMNHVPQHMTIDHSTQDRIDLTEDEDKLPYKCVFSSCGARFSSPSEHTEHLLRAHQLRVLTVPDSVTHAPPKRGRPPKTMHSQSMKMDPLDPKEEITYDMQVDRLKGQPQYLPKLRVQSLFQ